MKFLGRNIRLAAKPADTAAPVLAAGTHVGTPEGPGVVDRIELSLLTVGDHVELDVPQVYVRLERSGEIARICLCKLVLHDAASTEALHSEFHRLWPELPEEEDLPRPLAAALLEATGKLTISASGAATALQHYRDPEALLRAATTAAVLNQPRQQRRIERSEAAVLNLLRRQ